MLTGLNYTEDEFGFIEILLINNKSAKVKLTGFGAAEVLWPCDNPRLSVIHEPIPKKPSLHTLRRNARKKDIWSLGNMLLQCMSGETSIQVKYDLVSFDNAYMCQLLNDKKWGKCRYKKTVGLLRKLLNASASNRVCMENLIKHEWFEKYYKQELKYGNDRLLKRKDIKKTALPKWKYDANGKRINRPGRSDAKHCWKKNLLFHHVKA